MSKLDLCYLDSNLYIVTCGTTYTPWRVHQGKGGTEVYNINTQEKLSLTKNPAASGRHKKQYALSQPGEQEKLLSDLERYVWSASKQLKKVRSKRRG
jgi:hypothetical protein